MKPFKSLSTDEIISQIQNNYSAFDLNDTEFTFIRQSLLIHDGFDKLAKLYIIDIGNQNNDKIVSDLCITFDDFSKKIQNLVIKLKYALNNTNDRWFFRKASIEYGADKITDFSTANGPIRIYPHDPECMVIIKWLIYYKLTETFKLDEGKLINISYDSQLDSIVATFIVKDKFINFWCHRLLNCLDIDNWSIKSESEFEEFEFIKNGPVKNVKKKEHMKKLLKIMILSQMMNNQNK